MAWTAPRDWVADEVVTAAIMNSAVRDNLRYLKGLDGAITFEDDIVTSNNVDGIDVSAHEARHVSGGADAIDSALAIAAMADLADGKVWKGDVSNRPAEIDFPTRTLSAANETVTEGYYAGTTLSAVDADLAVANIRKSTVVFGFTGTLEPLDDAAAEASVAMFQAYPAIGDVTSPENLNDNGTGTLCEADAQDEYAIVVYGDLVKIKRYRHYGQHTMNGDGEFKIQYWNVVTDAWVDWVTGIATRVASWSDLATEAEVITTAIKVINTTIDSAGDNKIGELEVIF